MSNLRIMWEKTVTVIRSFRPVTGSTFRRWLVILWLATWVAVLGGFALALWRYANDKYLWQTFGIFPDGVRYSATLLVFVLLCSIVLRFLPLRWRHFRQTFRYPSIWMAIFIGGLTVFAADQRGWLGSSSRILELWQWGVFLLLMVSSLAFALLVNWALSGQRKNPDKPKPVITKGAAGFPQDLKALEGWIWSERPSDEDFLNRRTVARRFADLLLVPFGKDTTLGLVGSFGSGKTSIVRWIKCEAKALHMAEAPDLWICETSCWGFEDSASAIRYILGTIVERIEEEVECSSLRELPETYRKAISTVSGKAGPLVDILLGQNDPVQKLRMLTPILEAVHARLVVAVEDLDRSKSARFDPSDVRALLQQLKDVCGVSFILTGSASPSSRPDFAKLCDHIEIVPPMDEEQVCKAVVTIRKHYLTTHSDLNPSPETMRHDGAGMWGDTSSKRLPYELFGIEYNPPANAAISLMRTPRTLKHALRHTLTAWKKLHGEIDFDDLLITNVLKHGAPEAFDFLLNSINVLRSRPPEGLGTIYSQKEEDKRRERVQIAWDDATVDAEWDWRAARSLIIFLLPNAAKHLKDTEPTPGEQRLQGIQHVAQIDYWQRLLAGELAPGEISDQETLRAIARWVREPVATSSLVQRMLSEEKFAGVWYHFGSAVPENMFLRLADQVFEAVLQRDGARASMDHAGVQAITSRAGNHRRDDDANREWLISRLRGVLPRSLDFCNGLYYWWTSPHKSFVSLADRQRIREAVVSEAQRAFIANPKAVLNAITEEIPYSIYQLVFVADGESMPSVLRDPAEWQWFAPVLLAAAALDQNRMIPQLARLVMDRQRDTMAVETLTVLSERLIGMFGDHADEVMTLLAKAAPHGSETEKEYLVRVKEKAAEWFRQKAAQAPSAQTAPLQ
jgi:KAP family P-loop domain